MEAEILIHLTTPKVWFLIHFAERKFQLRAKMLNFYISDGCFKQSMHEHHAKDACCGIYPNRLPFDTLSRECCRHSAQDGDTTFTVDTLGKFSHLRPPTFILDDRLLWFFWTVQLKPLGLSTFVHQGRLVSHMTVHMRRHPKTSHFNIALCVTKFIRSKTLKVPFGTCEERGGEQVDGEL